MDITTVIFDLGGVLSVQGSHAKLITDHGIEYDGRQARLWNELKKGRMSEDEYWRDVVRGTDREGTEQDLKQKIGAMYSCRTAGGALPYVEQLHRNGYQLGILSNHATEWGWAAIRTLGIEKLFHSIVVSADVGLAKPDHEIYHVTLGKLGKQDHPEQCLFIDDKIVNVMAAQDTGMHAIQYIGGRRLKEQLARYGVR